MSDVLQTVERIVVIAAGIMAIFPLYQYYIETEDRARARLVDEAILAKECLALGQLVAAPAVDWGSLKSSPLTTAHMELNRKCRILGLTRD